MSNSAQVNELQVEYDQYTRMHARACAGKGIAISVSVVTELPITNTDQQALDGAVVAADFPILQPGDDGRRVTYLDSAASAQKPRAVLDAMRDAYENAYANVHRGVYGLAAEATNRFERTRETVRRFLNASSPREIIFTRGTTEAINLVAASWGRENLGSGDIVVLSELEHHSNLVPWQQIAKERGADIRFIPVDEHGVLDLNNLEALATGGNLKMVSVAHVSNSMGTVIDLRQIVDWAKSHHALVLVDGAQAAPHRPVDVQEIGCDFYAFSSHKLLGPTGAGALWGREAILAKMKPYQYGGEMIRKVDFDDTTFNSLPWKFEAGTPAIVEVIGMGAAIEYLEALGMDRVLEHDRVLSAYAYEALSQIDGLKIYGPPPGEDRGGIVSFTMECAHPHDIASVLDESNICVRAGHHCAQPLMRKLGITATARASMYVYNTVEDVDRLVAGLGSVERLFKRGSV